MTTPTNSPVKVASMAALPFSFRLVWTFFRYFSRKRPYRKANVRNHNRIQKDGSLTIN